MPHESTVGLAASRRRRWTPETVMQQIYALHAAGADLSYSGSRAHYGALHRAATRRYGSWREAVQAAGISYDAVRRRASWTEERVRACVRELSGSETDLSVAGVAASGRRDLLAAAHRLGGWPEVLRSVGISYQDVRRTRRWSVDSICDRISDLAESGTALNAGAVEAVDAGVVAAARRIMGSWPEALRRAGYDPAGHMLRRPRREVQQSSR